MSQSSQRTELRVFISSTFRDLQEEREYLVKRIFPEIRAICRERGITFTEVDLRWGLTEEVQVLGQIIRTCLEEVDRCRPYFLGIVGDRYGYTPEIHEIHKDGELLRRFPWIEDAIMDGASIIDLEFRYGALDKDAWGKDTTVAPHAEFFFRRGQENSKDAAGSDEDQEKLAELKQRVRDSQLPVEEFRDPETLGRLVYEGLLKVINNDFAQVRPLTPLEMDRAKHEAFAASRRVAYIPNVAYVKRLNDFAKSEEAPLIVHAQSGSGKSSLVSYWAAAYRRKNPSAHVIEHYVGIGAGATDRFGIIRHLMEEIKERFQRTEEIPGAPDALESQFANWLGYGLDTPIVIILDGVNQLAGTAQNVDWLPKVWPANIRFVITTTEESTLERLQQRQWNELVVHPLEEKEREAIIVRFLSDYRKALSAEQVRRIASDSKSSHPLFLRTLLEELRVFGQHEHLDREIDRYLSSADTEDLFQHVLARMEHDFGVEVVRDVLSLIWAARTGLAEGELQELTRLSRLKLSSLITSLDYHLLRRDGLLTFFHDYLRRAVERRYLDNDDLQREKHLQLADYFETIVREIIARDEQEEAAANLITI